MFVSFLNRELQPNSTWLTYNRNRNITLEKTQSPLRKTMIYLRALRLFEKNTINDIYSGQQ